MRRSDPPSHYRALLEQGRWFAGLPPPCRDALVAAAEVRTLAAGAMLFRRGDANAGLYCVLEGRLHVGSVDAQARNAMLGVLEPPQWFGEIACLDGGPRTHDATAHSAATLLMVPLHRLEALAAADARWWRYLGQLLAEKARAVMAGLEDLTRLGAPARVARRLLAMDTGHGMLAEGQVRQVIAVNQEQLGAMLALTRQTVGEVLRDFEARGLVRRRYGAIELLDRAALRAVGDATPG